MASRTGSARAPSRTISPSTPTEKSPRHRVHARVQAGHRLHEHAVVDAGDQLVEGPGARRDRQRLGADPGRRAVAPHGRGGRGHAGAAARSSCCGGSPAARRRRSARCAGWPGPRRRGVSAPSERGSVGSSTSVSSGEAIGSPTRSANGERPFSTDSPLSVPATTPSSVAAMRGSSTRVTVPLVGLHGARAGGWPARRRRRRPRRGRCRRARGPPTRRSRSWSRRRRSARACTDRWQTVERPGHGDAGRGRDRADARAVAPRRDAHARRCGGRGARHRPLEARAPARPCGRWACSARPSRHRSTAGGATPSGSASPTHSSGSAKAALSRASASTSAMTAASSDAGLGEALAPVAARPARRCRRWWPG